ncbi:Hypothetical_protein [Hexamita inflata]|uniref:Hypothetical_protein n=1 Tax=Hexamita inflata TaxID=28002 RepID=A0AA86QV94_9EUKA|nr:Hypothetical protein HINF_LOCUS49072 [Hexamita inflata]
MQVNDPKIDQNTYKPSIKSNSLKSLTMSGSMFFNEKKLDKTNSLPKILNNLEQNANLKQIITQSIKELKRKKERLNDIETIADSQLERLSDQIKANRRNCIEMVREKMKKEQFRQQMEERYKHW